MGVLPWRLRGEEPFALRFGAQITVIQRILIHTRRLLVQEVSTEFRCSRDKAI